MLDALEAPPKASDLLFWADFVELKALIHPDRCYSRGDLASLIKRGQDTGTIGAQHGFEARWRDLIDFAGARTQAFGAAYPFKVTDDHDTLERVETLEGEQYAYLSLLLASLMRHFPRHMGPIARFFEQVSHTVFCKLMPPGAEVHPCWAAGGNTARYTGTLYQKMQAIAHDIRCTANFSERDFKRNDSGDGGIDIVAWHPMADERAGIPIAFAQCGCSKADWTFKQLEASPAKHGHHFPVMHPWATYYFMPLDLRHPDGDWACKSDIGAAIIVDRLRLIRLARQYTLFSTWPALPLLQEVLAAQIA